jgi:hypothetical protein
MMIKNLYVALAIALAAIAVDAQVSTVKRTMTKTDVMDFGSGGTIAVIGAPNGSVNIIGTTSNTIEITARIHLEAPNDAAIAKLADVTTFVTTESMSRVTILSIGTHDKAAMKKIGKKLPMELMGLPFRIDYDIKVPRYCDIEIDGGSGEVSISGTEGAMRVNFVESHADLELTGQAFVTIGKGSAKVWFGPRGWRGRQATVSVGSGDLTAVFPENTSADLDAVILRTGSIGNSIATLKPRDRKVIFTERSMIARFAAGGSLIKLTVGDGSIKISNPDRGE